MSNTKQNPFAAALLRGEDKVTIFSGGACLEVFEAHPDLNLAWEWFENGLAGSEHCRVALEAVYDIYVSARGPVRPASYFPDSRVGKSLSRGVSGSKVPA